MSETQAIAEKQDLAPKAELEGGGAVAAIVPRTLEEMFRVAKMIYESGMYPESYQVKGPDAARATAARLMIGIMKGSEVGFPPISALQHIAVINNRPCIWGDGAKALIEKSGLVEDFIETLEGEPDTDQWTAICKIKKHGNETPIERCFSWGDAKRAGLLSKQPWKLYPQRMLKMRARSWAIRDGFSECLSGLQLQEEIEDMPLRDISPPDTSFLDDAIEHHGDEPISSTEEMPETAVAGETPTPPEEWEPDDWKAWLEGALADIDDFTDEAIMREWYGRIVEPNVKLNADKMRNEGVRAEDAYKKRLAELQPDAEG